LPIFFKKKEVKKMEAYIVLAILGVVLALVIATANASK